jgi:hypothetical protein
MNWNIKKEVWQYKGVKFIVEVVKWEEYGIFHWNKYLYLYEGHKDFNKYLPTENRCFPETPYDFNGGVTFFGRKQ